MTDTKENILVWLPSPMGDAILCTPALRAIRKRFSSSKITFYASALIHQVFTPCSFTNAWLEQNEQNVFAAARILKRNNFTRVIMFKNSFGSALTCWLAGIPVRTGYARDGRGILLTEKLYPPRLPSGEFKPITVVDYYLAIAAKLGAYIQDKSIELAVEQTDTAKLKAKLPVVFDTKGPVVILVPGAAAGPSKRWFADRFAQVADRLTEKYNATIVLSVAPNADEKNIAKQIFDAAKHKPINIGDTPVGLGELKALIGLADLIVCNDTGPRHIAIGLKRKVITLVGPNDPVWTDPGYADEIFIKGDVPCAPCDKPVCKKTSHFCMEAITVDMVCKAASKVLDAGGFGKRGGL